MLDAPSHRARPEITLRIGTVGRSFDVEPRIIYAVSGSRKSNASRPELPGVFVTNAGKRRSLRARLVSFNESRFAEVVLPLLGGFCIAMLAALIMKYV